MSFEKLLIVSSIITIFVVSCTSSSKLTNTANSCIIFEEKENWYKASKKSYDNWKTPIALQLAIINQESSFQQFAKPKRRKLFGIIPSSRPSSAFGYAQVTNPTWEWYKSRTGNINASRANFKDITDFIGWYSEQTEKILGISKKDAFNQYLAYHEGQEGWRNESYKSKDWLIKVANNVKKQTDMYNIQLKKCEKDLNKTGLFGFL